VHLVGKNLYILHTHLLRGWCPYSVTCF